MDYKVSIKNENTRRCSGEGGGSWDGMVIGRQDPRSADKIAHQSENHIIMIRVGSKLNGRGKGLRV